MIMYQPFPIYFPTQLELMVENILIYNLTIKLKKLNIIFRDKDGLYFIFKTQ